MIRKSEINDKNAIVELFSELVAHHVEKEPDFFKLPERGFFEEEISKALSDENEEIWVNDNGGINAYAVLKIIDVDYPDRYPYKLCHIDCFGVKKGLRRSGIGTALMAAVKERAKELGCSKVQLKANVSNTEAVEFYEKVGFIAHAVVMTEKLK